LKDDAPVVRHAQAAAVRTGLQPSLRIGNGGLDANWLVRHGIPTITFGAGQNNIHTVEEYVDLPTFLAGCRMALALATSEG
jgi:tripeptide aminopeptidase